MERFQVPKRKACLAAAEALTVSGVPFDKDRVLVELREVLAEAQELIPTDGIHSRFETSSETSQAVSLLRSAIERFTPENSSYRRQVGKLTHNAVSAARADTAQELSGVLSALIRDYEKDRLRTLEELIHSDVSGDYLQQAETLLRAGYKDPAVVLAGSVLEQHLRQLAAKHGVGLFAGPVWKKADRLNSDLAKDGVYGKTEQKTVTALLGRRNEAAHGNYDLYDQQEARLHLDQVQGFIARFPA